MMELFVKKVDFISQARAQCEILHVEIYPYMCYIMYIHL